MVFERRFEFGLAWRVALMLAALALLVGAFAMPGLVAARIVAALVATAALHSLWAFVRRTNFEVARFVDAVGFHDFSQRFSTPSGGGFDILGAALDEAMRTLRERRARMSEETLFLSLVLDDAPVALLTVADDGAVALLNKAARAQFDRHQGSRLADYETYGAEFATALALPPGGRRLTRIMVDGVAQRVMLSTARVERIGTGLTIASVLPVQNEVGAAELAAQTDLVRVLTHEIMNSLTPVTSLAHSTAEVVGDAVRRDPTLADARLAVETLARRADGILGFVDSYRQFARSFEPQRQRFAVLDWASEIGRLAAADAISREIALTVAVHPPTLIADGDPNLLAQVGLNLIRNAAIATLGRADRWVMLSATATPGRRIIIEVADNGPGIPVERREDVFLPFYTTRPDGTGVGLSFAKQVVIAHGGSIMVDGTSGGGAIIRMLI